MEYPTIVIIGAGFSGLAAAQTLFRAGITNVCILEAKDRIGGRVHTQIHDNMSSHIEIGAQWIHGEGSNPVYLLAKENDLVVTDLKSGGNCGGYDESNGRYDAQHKSFDEKFASLYGSLKRYDKFYTEIGQLVSRDLVKETCDALNSILHEARIHSRNGVLPTFANDSMGLYFRELFDSCGLTTKDMPDVCRLRRLLLGWQYLIQNIENACETLYDVSLNAWGQYMVFEGEGAVVLKYGYKAILALLANDIPVQAFHLGAEVKTIELEDKNAINNAEISNLPQQIVISLSDGEQIRADYVIVTCSLGVLKAHARTMFIPPLPSEKQMAIERMGFGTVNKIFLQFEDPFWEPDTTSLQLLWIQDTDPPLQEADLWVPECLSAADLQQYGTWYRGIHGFDVVSGHRNLLCGWIAGVEAITMETVPDDLVIEVCLAVLRRFTGKAIEARPTRLVRSSWHSDAHVLGSYSFIRAGNTGDNCDILCQPVPTADNPRIMFAGEATHREYFSTTHGALMSGQREANRILAHLRNTRY